MFAHLIDVPSRLLALDQPLRFRQEGARHLILGMSLVLEQGAQSLYPGYFTGFWWFQVDKWPNGL